MLVREYAMNVIICIFGGELYPPENDLKVDLQFGDGGHLYVYIIHGTNPVPLFLAALVSTMRCIK